MYLFSIHHVNERFYLVRIENKKYSQILKNMIFWNNYIIFIITLHVRKNR